MCEEKRVPIEYSFDAAKHVIRTVVTGEVTPAEVAAALQRVSNEPWFPAPSVADVREAAANFTGDQVRAVAADLRRLHPQLHDHPIAVIVSSDLSFGFVRMLGLLLDDVATIVPFRETDNAMVWLASRPPGSLPS